MGGGAGDGDASAGAAAGIDPGSVAGIGAGSVMSVVVFGVEAMFVAVRRAEGSAGSGGISMRSRVSITKGGVVTAGHTLKIMIAPVSVAAAAKPQIMPMSSGRDTLISRMKVTQDEASLHRAGACRWAPAAERALNFAP